MAGYGPPPSEERRRRNVDTFEADAVTIEAGTRVQAPRLPGASKYLKATLDWYEAWASSPQAATFVSTDWQRLHMLAKLVDDYWRNPDVKLMAEIRQNESLLGATHVDRMRGRIKVSDTGSKPSTSSAPEAGAGANNVTPLSSRRARLLAEEA